MITKLSGTPDEPRVHDRGCTRCGNRLGHDQLAEAECAFAQAQIQDLLSYAATLAKPPTEAAVRDLWASLRSGWQGSPDPGAHRTVRWILDHGWRLAVAPVEY